MIVGDVGREARRLGYRLLVTGLGAGVVVGRGLLRFASSLLPSLGSDASTRRHHASKIRERASAAEQAARASGLLSRRGR